MTIERINFVEDLRAASEEDKPQPHADVHSMDSGLTPSQMAMAAIPVVKDFDVIEDIRPGALTGLVRFWMRSFFRFWEFERWHGRLFFG